MALKSRYAVRIRPPASQGTASYLVATEDRVHPRSFGQKENLPWTTKSTISSKAAGSRVDNKAARKAASRIRERKLAVSKGAASRTATKKAEGSMVVASTAAAKKEAELERGAGDLLDTPNLQR